MILCDYCGVELGERSEVCPLCGKSLQRSGDKEIELKNTPSEIISIKEKENRRNFWELSAILAFSGIAVCTIIELLLTRKLKWSLFPDISIFTAWIILTLILYCRRRTAILIPGLVLSVLAAVLAFDLITPEANWFLPVGLPMAIAVFFAAALTIVLYRSANFKGFNIIASTLFLLAGLMVATEVILDEYLRGSVELRWSGIAAVSILPVALIFLFYHYRLKRGNRLDSFFHI
ncbi:MAG: DUF6320 domain-containing protein [Bacteroidales bacterium]|mgnify:CR=1 FL=1|jgi:ABC-type transport system involved in cytochrome c biogenesis permease subunit|nr:DUF6320 domain-containing protein [Bacteroidales bacterium]